MNPDFIFYFFGFFIGASIGSFYYTLSLRILKYFYGSERKKYSFYKKLYILLTKPSSCPACGHPVSIATLLPVAGFFVSGKKCKYCGDAISVRYPLTESLFGFLFILLFFLSSNFLFSLFALCLFGHLLISMHTDFYFFSVDYENLPFILIFGIISNFLLIGTAFDNTDFFVLFGFSFFYFTIWFFYKKGIGLGDVFFAPVFAFIAGHPW
ncbi:MAG: prepilin peptidase, partial [Leptospira sp.]|nr:prepilin peptidase [Leptospira sp.]